MHEQLTRAMPRMASQRGFSLFSAIFLLVMLSALGAAMVKVSTGSQIAAALDIQGERAYQAARAGIQWGLYRQLKNDSCVAKTSFALPAGNTLSSFTVTVNCQITRRQFSGALTNGGAGVSNVADTGMLAPGMGVWGTGIAAGATISSITGPTTLTLSSNATVGGVQSISYQSDLDTHALTSTACNQPVAGECPHAGGNDPDYVQRVLEARF
jgi:hypothetical protein